MNEKPLTPGQAEKFWAALDQGGFPVRVRHIGRWLMAVGGYEVPIVEL